MAILFSSSCSSTHTPYESTPTEFIRDLPSFNIEKTKSSGRGDGSQKISFYIRVHEILEENDLKEIAYHLKSQHLSFARIYIFYYQPGMELDQGAWATSHFNPELEIDIYGMTKANANNADTAMERLNQLSASEEIIGTWIDDRPFIPVHYIRITRNQSGQYYQADVYFTDLSNGKTILSKIGDKYVYENGFGEYFLVEPNGTLGWYNDNGKFAALKKAG